MQGAALAAWKAKSPSFYECMCDGDHCRWSGLNDDVVEGTGKNLNLCLNINYPLDHNYHQLWCRQASKQVVIEFCGASAIIIIKLKTNRLRFISQTFQMFICLYFLWVFNDEMSIISSKPWMFINVSKCPQMSANVNKCLKKCII